MDDNQFDQIVRTLTIPSSRRTAASGLLGSVLAALAPVTAAAADQRQDKVQNEKKGKGKGKGKGCPKGKQKCGKKCISKSSCCYRHDCEKLRGCKNESCINGTCQCAPELVMHNGVCGFLIPCKSFGEQCTDGGECCGNSCRDDGSGAMRCLGKSLYQCMSDLDCKSGPCRGFLCPEALEPYYSLCPGNASGSNAT
jgi:hypothetical protein